MWASERALGQADPAGALPHQYEALRLIQEYRRTERRFPRGSVAVDVVDLTAARGTGELDDAAPAERSRGAPLPDSRAALQAVEAAAAAIPVQDARAAALTLGALATRLLATPGVEPAVVTMVSEASDAALAGDRAGALRLLARARLRMSPPAGMRRPPMAAPRDPAGAEYFRRLGRP